MSMNVPSLNDELLVKFLLGEANDDEQKKVINWCSAHQANQQYLDDFRKILDCSRLEDADTSLPYDALKRLHKRMDQEGLGFHTSWKRFFPLAIAAIFLCVLFGWGLYFSLSPSVKLLSVTSAGKVLDQRLPDGTTVVLNKNSSLNYPSRFAPDQRSVALRGEAFFNVVKEHNSPFLINAGQAEIKVVGTSFNIEENDQELKVTVATGVVEVSIKNQKIRLHPREELLINFEENRALKSKRQDALYTYYFRKELKCQDTPLATLVNILEKKFQVTIQFANNKLADQRITVTFREESLPQIFEILEQTMRLKVTFKNEQYFLN